MMINRIFNLPKKLSFFLFGARGTGKTTLLNSLFLKDRAVWFDLLDRQLEGRFQLNPMLLESELEHVASQSNLEWVVIDEIQKVPELLDVVHRLIEKKRFRFALTGSSARKLKRGAANLLAGRALQNFLFPLTFVELKDIFDLNYVLRWGSLPMVFDLDEFERSDYLRTYAETYLKEEIQVEQIVRKLPPFRAFLQVAAFSSAKIINYSKIAYDINSDAVSVKSYFQILEDTLLGFSLLPFHFSVRKRQRQNPKFYFFDLGIQAALCNHLHIPVEPQTYSYGNLFEQFIIIEIFRLNHYFRKDWSLSYLRTKDDVEIDLIIERPGQKLALLEIKSANRITPKDLKQLVSLGRDIPNSEMFCFSLDKHNQIIDGVRCLHWSNGMEEIGLISNHRGD